MKIAIIGAGLAGLSVCYHLCKKYPDFQLTLFEQKAIAGGASGVASGLMHPYPGLEGRRSIEGALALEKSRELLVFAQKQDERQIADFSGILRYISTEEQRERFCRHAKEYGDVEQVNENLFLIRSGVTVFVSEYLQALWKGLALQGVDLFMKKITDLKEIEGEFDAVVLCVGAGVVHFIQLPELKLIKGQTLQFKAEGNEQSAIGKGYQAKGFSSSHIEIGSTFEREYLSEEADIKKALDLLKEQIAFFGLQESAPLACKAGVRVCRGSAYQPLIYPVSDKTMALTALGSRGLLYHGLYGERVASLLANKLQEA